jgi:hypothetical protein
MSDSEIFTVCPYCGQRVEPDDPAVRYGVEQKRLDHFRGSDIVDGMGGFFHPGCPMGAVGYVERDAPGSPTV